MAAAKKNLPSTVTNITGVFDPINFDNLNKAITKLASSNATLTPDEKKFAIDLIDDWDHSVIQAIDDKINEGQQLLYTFNPNHVHFELDDELCESLTKQLGTKFTKLYKDYLKTKNELFELQNTAPKQDRTRDINETAGAYIDRSAKEEAEYAKYQLKIAKARKAVEWAQYDFKKALSETPEIQEIIRRIKSFQKKSKSFKTACNDKSRLAKINVTISDENVREALKEIIDFKI